MLVGEVDLWTVAEKSNRGKKDEGVVGKAGRAASGRGRARGGRGSGCQSMDGKGKGKGKGPKGKGLGGSDELAIADIFAGSSSDGKDKETLVCHICHYCSMLCLLSLPSGPF